MEWNIHCQVCGDKMKAYEAIRRWDGLVVGKNMRAVLKQDIH